MCLRMVMRKGRGWGLWDSDGPHLRIIDGSAEQVSRVRDAVTMMGLENGEVGEGRDWQAIADIVVKHYGEVVHYLHADASLRRSEEAFT